MLHASEDVEHDGGHDYALPHRSPNAAVSNEQARELADMRTRMQLDHDHNYDNPVPPAANVVANDEADQLPGRPELRHSPQNPTTSSAAGNPADAAVEQHVEPTSPAIPSDTVDLTTTPAPSKKRRRNTKSNTPKAKATPAKDAKGNEEEDDGLTCPICLDNWEMSGEHRLVSLKCGHLFGNSCIRRWLAESGRQSGIKACPQCKSKVSPKDIRCLYAKRLRAIDRSEEHRLRDQLDEEKRQTLTLQAELASLKVSYTLVSAKVKTLESDNERMKHLLRVGGAGGAGSVSGYVFGADSKELARLPIYKLFMERNLEISREPGCRVMVHADRKDTMIVSQKSAQTLFPGYGLRFIDTPTFRTSNFVHASAKLLRDICLSADHQLVAVTSMEPRCKLFDLRQPQSAGTVFAPSDKALWSCAMDRAERENFLYLGALHGSTYLYDVRHASHVLEEFQMEGDFSPVINIATVPANKIFPGGGFIVCKLQSLWFYEYSTASATAMPTRLNVDGPFIAMNFDAVHELLLINVRNSVRSPQSRYFLGRVEKMENTPVFMVQMTFHGSKTAPVMTRSAQIAVEANTLIAGYLQDAKLLAIYDARRGIRTQSLPVQDIVYDTCPIYTANATFVAALTETKCRIYKLNQQCASNAAQ